LAATRHGAYTLASTGMLPRCGICPDAVRSTCSRRGADGDHCPAMAEYRAALVAESDALMDTAGGWIRQCDRPLLESYGRTLEVLAWIDAVVGAEGVLRPVVRETAEKPARAGEPYVRKAVGLDLHPLLTMRREYASLALKQADALGLSPAGRKRLELALDAGRKPATIDQIAAETAPPPESADAP
jgi:phage terminase small subunit